MSRGDDPRLTTRREIIKLSPRNLNVVAGTKISGIFSFPENRTFTGFSLQCDPANKPSASNIQVDLNTVHPTTGAATSLLSALAIMNAGASTGAGAISGTTYSYTAGTLLAIDIDQGSDGQGLCAYIDTTLTG